MSLYTLAIIDHHGIGRPIVQAVLYHKDQAQLQLLLQHALEWAGDNMFADTVFVVDKSHAEISALRALFTNSHILLCRFHMAKTFVAEIRKSNLTSSDQETLYKVCITDLMDHVQCRQKVCAENNLVISFYKY